MIVPGNHETGLERTHARKKASKYIPLNDPSACWANEPRFSAMALPMPPSVSPVDSVKLDGMSPNATRPYSINEGFAKHMGTMWVHTLFTNVCPLSTTEWANDGSGSARRTEAAEAAVCHADSAARTRRRWAMAWFGVCRRTSRGVFIRSGRCPKPGAEASALIKREHQDRMGRIATASSLSS